MAELVISAPDRPEQVVPLGAAPVHVGRAESCEAFIPELKASRRHLLVRVDVQGRVVAEDQGSSNGTWFRGPDGEQRFLRRVLQPGDELRIGETRLRLRDAPPPVAPAPADDAPLVSGTLHLQPATDAPAAPPPETAAAAPARPAPSREESVPAGPPSRNGLVRGLVICAAGLLALVAVEVFLGARADRQAHRRDAHAEALRVLDYADKGVAAFQRQRDAFAARYPDSPLLSNLDRMLDVLRQREEHQQHIQDQLNVLLGQLESVPPSEARLRLLQLGKELPGDASFARRIRSGLAHLDGLRAQSDREDLDALEKEARGLLAQGQPARAQRLVAAFEGTHDGMDAEVRTRWRALSTQVAGAVAKAGRVLEAAVEKEKDPARRRALMAAAWPGLAGTPEGVRIAERLRAAASRAAPRRETPPAGTPGTPGAPETPAPAPTKTDRLLERGKAAEALLHERAWTRARAALTDLVRSSPKGRLRAEWQERLGEVDQVLGLVRAFSDEVATAKHKPRRKLSDGTWRIAAADEKGVSLESMAHGSSRRTWKGMPAADVLALLTPSRLDLAQRHAVALLAANVGDRGAFVRALLPIYEKGGDLAATNALVARHLYGRGDVPAGGYSAYKGEILDAEGVHRRKTQERIAFLRGEAARLLTEVAKEPAFRKLAKLRALRGELDKRRRHALLAIFDTVHYPYPHARDDGSYWIVQNEIDGRIKAVKEIWDDELHVKIDRAGKLGKLLDAWDAALQELEIKKVPVADLRRKMAAYAMYVTGRVLNVRDFYRTPEEKELFAYNRWVLDVYNPARTEVVREPERQQIAITNAYRMMMGYTAVVTPGPAPYPSITKDNVVQILDQGKVDKMTPLRAVRIDNRLVLSARGHSEDMSKRGYFAHAAPANPATGEGPTMPHDRMQAQGYVGWGYSENIAMSPSPQQAHVMWLHSSGHHRNILSGWMDMGAGVGGRNFTQNFGNGGGDKPVIRPDTGIHAPAGRAPGGARARPGR